MRAPSKTHVLQALHHSYRLTAHPSSWQSAVSSHLTICVHSIPQEGLMETVFPEFSLTDKFASFLPKNSVVLEHKILGSRFSRVPEICYSIFFCIKPLVKV